MVTTAMKLAGPERGAVLLGFFGGLVSSTATTLSYSRFARGGNEFIAAARTVIVVASLVLLLRLAVLGDPFVQGDEQRAQFQSARQRRTK